MHSGMTSFRPLATSLVTPKSRSSPEPLPSYLPKAVSIALPAETLVPTGFGLSSVRSQVIRWSPAIS